MLGIIHKENKKPYVSLEKFVEPFLLEKCRDELENYIVLQERGAEAFVGYNEPDWMDTSFQTRQYSVLKHTTSFISSFCDNLPPFNIRYAAKNNSYYTILHQDIAPYPCNPTKALKENYKENLNFSLLDRLINRNDYKLVEDVKNTNSDFNSLDLDYEKYLKKIFTDSYLEKIKRTYKLHMVISKEKTMFIYDNVEDKIYDINDCHVCVFNPHDFHDTRPESWGISIQFPMHCGFLKQEIKDFLEI